MKVLETERLVLRQLSFDDADFIVTLLNDPSFLQNIGDKGVRTNADACSYLSNGPIASYARFGFGLYLVGLKDSGDSIGICGLLKRDELDDVDIGFAILPKYWSKGYAVEAALAVMAYARKVIELNRIVAITKPDNAGSIRVLEKIGFRFEKMIKLSDEGHELKLFASEV
ncbi:MAG: GNAT family N-acetyltransferase [Acidobacteria bacterium]|nr:GNAT family N-acetyltransferase [Acidobacteriota bacterium]